MDFEHALIVALLLCLVSHGSADPGRGNTCQMKCKECQKMGSLRKIGSCVSECVQSGNLEGFDCIDECNGEGGGNTCDEVSTNCRNTVEAYECDCKDGYSYRVSHNLCAPNECSGEGGGNACDQVSTNCRNTVEGYECDCKDGYSYRVSDKLCAPNECIGEGGGNKCDKTTNCVDTEKGFTCECKKEFPERVDDVSCEAAKAALVRLVGGKTESEGRVEIFHDGTWGTICDDSWDNPNAKVVCRELGLPYTAAQAKILAFYGQGTGEIHLSNLHCTGTESQLTQCTHWGWGRHDGCTHINDAGVICQDAPIEHVE